MSVPLAELHVHLEGTATPELVRRLAVRNGLEIPPGTIEDGRYVWHDFLDFHLDNDRRTLGQPTSRRARTRQCQP